jgi:DNA-binding transcriptional ArsR family regulator
MIRLTIDDETLLRVRVATSPLWELLSSLAMLVRYRTELPPPYGAWAENARRELPGDLRRELLSWAAQIRTQRLPSFLVPVPRSTSRTIAEELADLRATPEELIRNELAVLYPQGNLLARMTGPDQGLPHLVDLFGAYWDIAMAPYWRSMRNVLEEEILLRGRCLATEGADAMLRGLGGRVHWEHPHLTLPCQTDIDSVLTRTQFYVVPVLFAHGMRIFSEGSSGSAVSYQARGSAVLDSQAAEGLPRDAAPGEHDRLAMLVGRGRAAVMRALTAPSTTTAVAQSLGLAQSTVSQHLSALSAARLVQKHRLGSKVLYRLDHQALELLRHLDYRSAE